jgi:hypothetical protein
MSGEVALCGLPTVTIDGDVVWFSMGGGRIRTSICVDALAPLEWRKWSAMAIEDDGVGVDVPHRFPQLSVARYFCCLLAHLGENYRLGWQQFIFW